MAHSPNQEKAGTEQDIASDQPILANQDNSTSPLSTALLRLPHFYFKALLKPSVRTFIQDKDGASWKLVWIQPLAWAILDAALGVLVNLISPPSISTPFLRFLAFVTS